MQGFETGVTIRARTWLVILLPPGTAAGFKRPGKKGWQGIWDKYGKHMQLATVGEDVIALFVKPDGSKIPVYKLTKKPVQLKKRLNFHEAAEKIADQIPEQIAKLI